MRLWLQHVATRDYTCGPYLLKMDSTACTDLSGLCHQLQTDPTRDEARLIYQTISHSYSSYATPANLSQQQLYHRRDAIAQAASTEWNTKSAANRSWTWRPLPI